MLTIIIFKARDGRWNYCPKQVRHWAIFDYEGTFPNEAAAMEAALSDKTIPARRNIEVER